MGWSRRKSVVCVGFPIEEVSPPRVGKRERLLVPTLVRGWGEGRFFRRCPGGGGPVQEVLRVNRDGLSMRTKSLSREAGGGEVASGSGVGCEECEEEESEECDGDEAGRKQACEAERETRASLFLVCLFA
jgi:hypothetical protein